MEPTTAVELGKLIGVCVGSAVGTGVITTVSLLSWFQRQNRNGRSPVSATDLAPIHEKLNTLLKTNDEQWSLIRKNERDIVRLDERTKNIPH